MRQQCDTPRYTPGWDHTLDALSHAAPSAGGPGGGRGAMAGDRCVKEKFRILRISSASEDACKNPSRCKRPIQGGVVHA